MLCFPEDEGLAAAAAGFAEDDCFAAVVPLAAVVLLAAAAPLPAAGVPPATCPFRFLAPAAPAAVRDVPEVLAADVLAADVLAPELLVVELLAAVPDVLATPDDVAPAVAAAAFSGGIFLKRKYCWPSVQTFEASQ